MPRAFVAGDEPFQAAVVSLFGTKAFHSVIPASTAQTSSVLRC
jgi:hypothetical protein